MYLFSSPEEHIRSLNEEEWITIRYVEYDFFLLFRMGKDTFQKLLMVIQCPELNKPYHGGGVPLNPEKSLWWLGKGESLNSIGDRFNVALSTVHHYAYVVVKRLVQLVPRFIQWPKDDEMPAITHQFQEIAGHPGVIGAIDGCNINFKAPLHQQDSYIDKNDKHSIKLQAIATSKRIFSNIFVGFPGSVHDARVFSNSEIYIKTLNNRRKYFPLGEYHLLGDKAYSLLEWLMTPYKDYGHLNRRQIVHNTKHSKTRMKVEHTFGILKSRWRILKYINVNDPKKAACCVLHNFCFINSDEWNEENEVRDENEDEADGGVYVNNEYIGNENRNNIANLFL